MYPIPANATRIRYLESTGTQYIDTGITPSVPSDTIYCKMASTGTYRNQNDSRRQRAFFGVLDGYGEHDLGARISWYAGYYGVEADNRVVASTAGVHTNEIRGKITEWTLGANERKVIYNGNTITTSNVVTTSYTYSGSSWIFGANGTGTGGGGLLACQVYAYKFWRNGVLLQDFIPLRIGSVGYLFDRVSGQLFGNAGTGSFVLGPDTFQQGVVPTRMCVMGVRKKEVWPTPLYTGVSLVGSSVQNNNGILSGFTSSSYATMPYYWTAGATSFVAVLKMHHTGASSAQGVWGCVGSKNAFTPFYQNFQYNVATFGSYLSANGSSWQTTPNGDSGTKRVAWNNSSPFAAGDYILKEEWDGTTVTTHRWTNGAWSAAETSNSLSSIYGEANLVPQLGTNRGSNNPFLGTIDLNYTYLMRDGELWWEGAPGAYKNVKTTYPD